MRNAVIASILFAAAQISLACDCIPIKERAGGAKESLAQAKYAVYAQVLRIDSSGRATLRVIESFKGSSQGSTIEITPIEHQCGRVRFSDGEKAFVISYGEPLTYCSKYAPEPFLLDAFRKASAK